MTLSSEKLRGAISGTSLYILKAEHRGPPTWGILVSGSPPGGRLLPAVRSLCRLPPGVGVFLLHMRSSSGWHVAAFQKQLYHGIATPGTPCCHPPLSTLLPLLPPRPPYLPQIRHDYLSPTSLATWRSLPRSPWYGMYLDSYVKKTCTKTRGLLEFYIRLWPPCHYAARQAVKIMQTAPSGVVYQMAD